MVNFALSQRAGQTLVSGLHAEFMATLPERIEDSSYLTGEFKGALLDFYDSGPKRMADALSLGIIGSELADESSIELHADGGRLWGPARLYAPSPAYYNPLGLKDLTSQMVATIRSGDPSATVLELVGVERPKNRVPIQGAMKDMFAGGAITWGQRPYVSNVQAGWFRWPSLTLLEASLRHLYGLKAPIFCHASYDISPTDLNDLHELGYRMVGLVLEATAFDGRKSQPPMEFLMHEIEHTGDYVEWTPFVRRVSAQYLRILEHHLQGVPIEQYSRSRHIENTKIRLDTTKRVIMDAQSDLATISYELARVFNPNYVHRIGRDLLAQLEYDRAQHHHSVEEERQYEAATERLEEVLEQAQQALAA